MTKRTVLAFVLAIVFFSAYMAAIKYWIEPGYLKPAAPAQTPAGGAPSTTSEIAGPEAVPSTAAAVAISTEAVIAPQPAQAAPLTAPAAPPGEAPPVYPIPEEYRQENIAAAEETVTTDLLTVVFTNRTGSIKSVTLNGFENFERNGRLVLLRDYTTGRFPTSISEVAGESLANRLYVEEGPPQAGPGGATVVKFATVTGRGVKITKTYTIEKAKYGVGLEILLENLAPAGQEFSYEVYGPTGIPRETYTNYGQYVLGVMTSVATSGESAGKMTRPVYRSAWDLIAGDMTAPPGARVNFAGSVNNYFASALRPDNAVPVEGADCYGVEDSGVAASLFGDKPPREAVKALAAAEAKALLQRVYYMAGSWIKVGKVTLAPAGAPGATAAHAFILYCGPKDKAALAAFDKDDVHTAFPWLLDYGWFEPIVKIILFMLWAFHKAIPNWGVAIILLTILIRGIMHPLTKKSQVSMAKMQKLQPHIKKLQEKYKGDKQKLGAEQMKLMREAGANPLGGCLPMIIQLPIFYALYKALMVSIELRQAPFVLWISDLAQPDRLLTLPFTLPVVANELNLLPLLMLAAMFWQQKISPKPATPEAAQQQKIMMLFMPIFLGAVLYRVASGLNLYILVSTLFGIGEQWIIRRHLAAQEAEGGQRA